MTSPCQKDFSDCRCEPCTDLREAYDATVVQTAPNVPRAANWDGCIPKVEGRIVHADDKKPHEPRKHRAASLQRQVEGSHRKLMSGRKHGGALGLLMALRQGR